MSNVKKQGNKKKTFTEIMNTKVDLKKLFIILILILMVVMTVLPLAQYIIKD